MEKEMEKELKRNWKGNEKEMGEKKSPYHDSQQQGIEKDLKRNWKGNGERNVSTMIATNNTTSSTCLVCLFKEKTSKKRFYHDCHQQHHIQYRLVCLFKEKTSS